MTALRIDPEHAITHYNYANMLKSMGKVKGSDLALLRQQFRVLDVNSDGVLNADDITEEREAAASQWSSRNVTTQLSSRKINV